MPQQGLNALTTILIKNSSYIVKVAGATIKEHMYDFIFEEYIKHFKGNMWYEIITIG